MRISGGARRRRARRRRARSRRRASGERERARPAIAVAIARRGRAHAQQRAGAAGLGGRRARARRAGSPSARGRGRRSASRTASSVSSAATLVAIRRDGEDQRERAERADARVLEDLEAAFVGRVRADRVGDVGEAVLVQRAGDEHRGGDREQRGRERREDLVGGGAGGGRERRRRAGRRAGSRPRRGSGPGRAGSGTGRRVRKASAVLTTRARRSAGRCASSRTAIRMWSASRPRSSVGRTAMPARAQPLDACPRGTLTRRKFAAPG